jgi:hypothetical protein
MSLSNVAASVRQRLLNRARETGEDYQVGPEKHAKDFASSDDGRKTADGVLGPKSRRPRSAIRRRSANVVSLTY